MHYSNSVPLSRNIEHYYHSSSKLHQLSSLIFYIRFQIDNNGFLFGMVSDLSKNQYIIRKSTLTLLCTYILAYLLCLLLI